MAVPFQITCADPISGLVFALQSSLVCEGDKAVLQVTEADIQMHSFDAYGLLQRANLSAGECLITYQSVPAIKQFSATIYLPTSTEMEQRLYLTVCTVVHAALNIFPNLNCKRSFIQFVIPAKTFKCTNAFQDPKIALKRPPFTSAFGLEHRLQIEEVAA